MHSAHSTIFCSLILCCVIQLCQAAEQGPGEWLQWRRDSQRTGRALMPGAIKEPKIVGSYFLGGRRDWLEISPTGKSENLALPEQDQPFDADKILRDWELDRWIDVEDSGKPEKVAEKPHERYLKIFKGEPGFQRISFESAFEKGNDLDNRGWLEQRKNGEWKRLWTSPQDKTYYRPLIVMADVDDDGEDEIVITVHYRIMAFKAKTGEMVRKLEYSHYRNYGELHAVDLNGDKRLDFVQFVSFPAHLEVILNDGKEFKLAWLEDVQFGNITDADHALSVPRNPVADVDGDGKPEIVYARYNQHGDKKWHTLALDALTGKVKYDLPDFVAAQALPAGPAGQIWLFGAKSDGPYVPTDGEAQIQAIENGAPKLIWEDSKVAWCTWHANPYFDQHFADSMGGNPLAARADGSLVWCRVKKSENLYQLLACEFARSKQKITASVDLPDFEILGFREKNGAVLIQTRRNQQQLAAKSEGASLSLIGSDSFKDQLAAPVVYRGKDGSPEIMIPDLLGGIQTLKGDANGFTTVRPRIDGFGMPGNHGIAVARGANDIRKPVVIQTNQQGEACVVMLNDEGKTQWNYPLNWIHPVTKDQSQGGLANYQTLPLFDASRDDVLVTALKNNMHSAYTQALKAEDGSLGWRKDKSGEVGITQNDEVTVQVDGRGYGGACMFAGFPKPDGTEDLVSNFPDLIYRADGRTGNFVVSQRTQLGTFYQYDEKNDMMKNAGALYATPIVMPRGFVWGGCLSVAGFYREIEKGGGFLWHTAPTQRTTSLKCPLQAVGDFNGDGKWELIGWEPGRQRLTSRDLWTGERHWSMELAGADAPLYYVSGDVDGDKKDEVLICTKDELLALGDKDGQGFIKWRLKLPAQCVQPVLADVEGDGNIEILLPAADGNLYLVDDPEKNAD